MTWKMEIHNKMKKQLNMCELSVHNGKVILIDSDKCYDKKMGKMLKTNDNKYVSKKVINNKKNKLYWRHLYSYLPWETIELINQMIYQYKMKSEILGIENIVYFRGEPHLNQTIWDIYGTEGIRWDRKVIKENEWINVEYKQIDIFDTSIQGRNKGKANIINYWDNVCKKFNKNIKNNNKKSNKFNQNLYRVSIYDMCIGLLKNGDICGCKGKHRTLIDRDYYNGNINRLTFVENGLANCNRFRNNRYRNDTEISLCKRHSEKYAKMNKKDWDNELEKMYNKLGYKVKDGYMCQTC